VKCVRKKRQWLGQYARSGDIVGLQGRLGFRCSRASDFELNSIMVASWLSLAFVEDVIERERHDLRFGPKKHS